jgi:predicted DNA-binding protein (UPF0251 family)
MSAAAVLPLAGSAERVRGVRREEPRPELAFYRKYTEGMLRRYVRMALESGRVPSLLGREIFRGRVTNYRVQSFEDVVIFVYDVESCLKRLDGQQQELIARIGMQEYTQGETAAMLGMSLRTVVRRYAAALDELTAILLEARLMEPHLGAGWEAYSGRCTEVPSGKDAGCQGGKRPVRRASC